MRAAAPLLFQFAELVVALYETVLQLLPCTASTLHGRAPPPAAIVPVLPVIVIAPRPTGACRFSTVPELALETNAQLPTSCEPLPVPVMEVTSKYAPTVGAVPAGAEPKVNCRMPVELV